MDSTSLSEFQDSLLRTINACGRTLLDTVNQVLDYSKIVSLGRNWRYLRKSRETSSEVKGSNNRAPHLDTLIRTDVAVLAEEVVEGVCLGHRYGEKSNVSVSADQPMLLPRDTTNQRLIRNAVNESDNENDVEVIIDIARKDWVYKTQPGALRRIIMNIFGNAVKYTENGRVSIKLEVSERQETSDDQSSSSSRQGPGEELMMLTVSDTGKGISQEFLRNRLYTPFAQEDSLTVGTGLGLSIVRSIVKALNGSITVHSRPREGTVVKVLLPLTRPVDEEEEEGDQLPASPHEPLARQRDTSAPRVLREGYTGRKAAIFGVDPENLTENPRWAAIAQYLVNWYGLELVSWPSQTPIDILMADESDLPTELKDGCASPKALPALLVFCNRPVRTAKFHWLSLAPSVNILRRPCGPHKLANSILKCLNDPQAHPPPLSLSTFQPSALPERLKNAKLPLGDKSPACNVLELLTERNSESDREGSVSQDTASVDATAKSESLDSLSTEPATTSSSLPTPSPPCGSSSKILDSAGTQSPPPQPARVLVVDDNAINRNLMLTFMKKRKNFVFDSADNGKLAVEAVERMPHGYDVIFMGQLTSSISAREKEIYMLTWGFYADISMPVMDGFEATRAIRALEKECDDCGPATIIALTGLSSESDELEALASGVDLFLTKPVSFKEVSRLLDEWESKREMSREQQEQQEQQQQPSSTTTATS